MTPFSVVWYVDVGMSAVDTLGIMYNFFLPMAEQQLIGIRFVGSLQLVVTAILDKIQTLLHWTAISHNLPYRCLACITLGYAYFKEMNTLQIDLSGLQFWSQLLFWGVETCIWHKNPTYIQFLRPCVCLSIMDLLLNLDYLVCMSKIHISHCTHIVGILIFSCQMALQLHHFIWTLKSVHGVELTAANSWKVLYKILLKYEVCILLHYAPIDTILTSIKAEIIWLSVPGQISKGKKSSSSWILPHFSHSNFLFHYFCIMA